MLCKKLFEWIQCLIAVGFVVPFVNVLIFGKIQTFSFKLFPDEFIQFEVPLFQPESFE